MKHILLFGAGLSASSLIRYLLNNCEKYNWHLTVVDRNLELLQKKLQNNPRSTALCFNATEKEARFPHMQKADLIISMLPARFHVDIAKDCLELKKNLITPSYISAELKQMHESVKDAGILFMNEIGVDPGIDHMSAMRIIDEIHEKQGEITSFKSYCGGLMAPESDNNPWNYKFTWNPRNVVLAGQGGTAQYIDRGQYKFIPYSQLFARLDKIFVDGYGSFEGYANRDSLSYREVYDLKNIPTIYRGTLRRTNFASAWNVFVVLGMCDDSFIIENSEFLTPRDFLNSYIRYNDDLSVEDKFKLVLEELHVDDFDRFEWLGIFDGETPFGIKDATPAQLLESILVKKLVLSKDDKDMLVMVHQFEYLLENKKYFLASSMVDIGEDSVFTSMSNTVGLPLAICAKLMLEDKVSLKGVHLPITKEVYEPILNELEELGIHFKETVIEIPNIAPIRLNKNA